MKWVNKYRKYLSLKKHGPYFMASACPFCDKDKCFLVSSREDRWCCFICHWGGDYNKFVEELKKLDPKM